MPRDITYTVYKYEELPEDVQQEVCDKYWDWNVQDEWWYENIIDFWKEKLEILGFSNAKIYFSGFWNQGDGACFDANVDLYKVAEHLQLCSETYEEAKLWRAVSLAHDNGQFDSIKIVTHNYRYSHENTRFISIDFCYLQGEKIYEKACEIEEFRRKLCQQIYSDLESEYEYFTSPKQVAESLIANEYEFTIKGEMI